MRAAYAAVFIGYLAALIAHAQWEASRWQEFAIAHRCKLVKKDVDYIKMRPREHHGYLCDDGRIHWR